MVVLAGIAIAACGDDDNTTTKTPAASGGATTAAASGQVGGSVDVLGIWGDVELTNFQAMVKPWETAQNAKVNFTGTRSITTDLNTRTA